MRLYDRLFQTEHPGEEEGKDFLDELNPGSREVLSGRVEPALAIALKAGERVQLERVGYFCVDPDSEARARSSSTGRSASGTRGRRSRRK